MSRRVVAFHQPAILAKWIGTAPAISGLLAAEARVPYQFGTLRSWLRQSSPSSIS